MGSASARAGHFDRPASRLARSIWADFRGALPAPKNLPDAKRLLNSSLCAGGYGKIFMINKMLLFKAITDFQKRLVLLFQPAYSPDINPIERVWQYLKKQDSWLYQTLIKKGSIWIPVSSVRLRPATLRGG